MEGHPSLLSCTLGFLDMSPACTEALVFGGFVSLKFFRREKHERLISTGGRTC